MKQLLTRLGLRGNLYLNDHPRIFAISIGSVIGGVFAILTALKIQNFSHVLTGAEGAALPVNAFILGFLLILGGILSAHGILTRSVRSEVAGNLALGTAYLMYAFFAYLAGTLLIAPVVTTLAIGFYLYALKEIKR